MHDYDPTHAIWGSPGTPPPNLEDQSLPFTRGLLSFGSGMGVKMTVTRLQQVRRSYGAQRWPYLTCSRDARNLTCSRDARKGPGSAEPCT